MKGEPMIARRWLISGRVQGVGYRNFVQCSAVQLGLSGYARNLDDGSVEVYATGQSTPLSKLAAALHTGPQMAHVRSVEEHEEAVESLRGFSIR